MEIVDYNHKYDTEFSVDSQKKCSWLQKSDGSIVLVAMKKIIINPNCSVVLESDINVKLSPKVIGRITVAVFVYGDDLALACSNNVGIAGNPISVSIHNMSRSQRVIPAGFKLVTIGFDELEPGLFEGSGIRSQIPLGGKA